MNVRLGVFFFSQLSDPKETQFEFLKEQVHFSRRLFAQEYTAEIAESRFSGPSSCPQKFLCLLSRNKVDKGKNHIKQREHNE
jgi:hypothetical protein